MTTSSYRNMNATSPSTNNSAGSVLDMWPLGVLVCGAGGMTSLVGLIYLIYDWPFTCGLCYEVCCDCGPWCRCRHDCSHCCQKDRYEVRRRSHWSRRHREDEANQRVEWEVVNTWDPSANNNQDDKTEVQVAPPRPTVLCGPVCATTEKVFVETELTSSAVYTPQVHKYRAVLVSEL
ncbi:rh172 [macacine betaherpesvirus 3]|uniref:Rh172 n=1 Tax=Rhesus cytomegalovirus (strain 68-1) TaxID=47929 RepID=Q2FAD1_RHCM6|nr:rh172 [macacine betaherpesvirus 3]APT40226.1 Rh172 [macacine betaherpesvirus 3]QXV50513.1 protein O19 [macacine betaherpesvirus 3]